MKTSLYTLFILILPAAIWAQGNCGYPSGFGILDLDHVETRINSGGDMWWDMSVPHYVYSDTPNANVIFAGSLWMGGIDDGGQLRFAGNTYRQKGIDFWPGPLDSTGNTNISRCFDWDNVWEVNRKAIQEHRQLTSQYIQQPGDAIPLHLIDGQILHWPAAGNPYFSGQSGLVRQLPVQDTLAPYVEVDGKPGYNPVYGDYPDVPGDQTLWWIFNDMGNVHTETQSKPIGVEVRAMAYGFNAPASIYKTTFYQFDITSKIRDLDSFLVGVFVDSDIGLYDDDNVGCDTVRNLAIGFNGDAFDGTAFGYGANPPMTALQWLRIPPRDNGQPGDMYAFYTYNNDFSVLGNPETVYHYYAFLNGRNKADSLTSCGPGFSKPSRFKYPDDPSDPNGCSECAVNNRQGDRRYVTSVTPLDLDKGETIRIVFAIIYARCPGMFANGCPSFDCIRQSSKAVSQFYNNQVASTLPDNRVPKASIQLYPNPASDRVHIHTGSLWAPGARGQLFSSLGSIVRTFPLEGATHTLSLQGLPPGTYWIRCESGNQTTAPKPLVVVR